MDQKNLKSKTETNESALANSRMSFGDHLLDLRSRIIKSIYGIIISFVICLFFGRYILGFISTPLLVALEASGNEPQLYVSRAPEAFLTYVKVSLYCSIFLSAPWTFYQVWGFVAAGLYQHERKYINIFAPFSAVLFMLGGAFFVLIVAPISFNFFITFGSKIQMPQYKDNFIMRALSDAMSKTSLIERTDPPTQEHPQPQTEGQPPPEDTDIAKNTNIAKTLKKPMVKPLFTLQEYIGFVTWLSLVFGLAFQMPLVVLMLGRLNLVGLDHFKSVRKYMLFAIVIASAVITPPDVVSQIALSVPMYALYELGILLLRFWPARK